MPTESARLDPFSHDGDAIRALVSFDASAYRRHLDPRLVTLVKLKVSLIIGSQFCVDRYMREAAANGECADRLAKVRIGQDAPIFSKREQAALEWAEIVTRAADTHVPDGAYASARSVFAPDELVALTMTIAAATAWNQVALSFRLPLSERNASA